jgi:hypothetical protein
LLISLSVLLTATAVPLGAANFLFTWNASPDTDISGYRVYQRTGDSDYKLLAEIEESGLDDPSHPSYLVTGLRDGTTYHFAASTVSAVGEESTLSDQTCITVNGQVVECQDNNQSGTTVFISCFITAAGHSLAPRNRKVVGPASLF